MRVKFAIFISTLSIILFSVSSCIGTRWNAQKNAKSEAFERYTFADVQNVLDQQIKAWNNGSIDGFMEGYWRSDSMLFITQKGPRYGYQAVSDSYKKNYPSKEVMGQLRFEVIKIQWVDQTAGVSQVLGKWHVGESTKPQSGYFSLIFKAINGTPKIVIDHTW
jgi:hypothetical protein